MQQAPKLPDSIDQLITELAKLPGIGRRTAQRLAFHLVRNDPERSLRLARAIDAARERVIK
jgi:recombination protein RecR